MLKGSEKQIKWAKDIIEQESKKIQADLDSIQERLSDRGIEIAPPRIAKKIEAKKYALEMLASESDASWIITHKNDLTYWAIERGNKTLAKEYLEAFSR